MGAKQSKRSVDISGKEGEGGGEVAAAGAGGEGRVEQLADSDALKPQLNGDAHIQHEQTDKEKELDSGTPENEKDATTEKEAKEEEDKDKESAPVTNGETEQKVENGESTPTPEDGKKPKKEKVKKKWSLRSISFSRKDKPKQEKKQKEEEPKTNGEPEKVPEETAAEASPEPTTNEVVEEAKAPVEEKDEKTPETPVTEPLTNGSSTPDSVKAATPAEEASPAAPAAEPVPADPTPEPKAEPEPTPAPAPAPAPEPVPEPEQLPVNGLSLEETKPETPAVETPDETKAEQPVIETVEITPAPEIPKEVCVERMPLLEPTPPPLPANPPPSSVASFAASTMAPELTDASLPNTGDGAALTLSALADTKHILDAQLEPPTPDTVDDTPQQELTAPLKDSDEAPAVVAIDAPPIEDKAPVAQEDLLPVVDDTNNVETVNIETSESNEPSAVAPEPVQIETPNVDIIENGHIENVQAVISNVEEVEKEPVKMDTVNNETPVVDSDKIVIVEEITKTPEVEHTTVETTEVPVITDNVATNETDGVQDNGEILPVGIENGVSDSTVPETTPEIKPVDISEPLDVPVPEDVPEPEADNLEVSEDSSLPPPPMEEDEDAPASLEADDKVEECLKQIPEPIADLNGTNGDMSNGHELSPDDSIQNLKKKAIAAADTTNGNHEQGDEVPPPPLAAHTAQEPISVSDKLADLIPEVPEVPEIKTETEQVLDVAVAN